MLLTQLKGIIVATYKEINCNRSGNLLVVIVEECGYGEEEEEVV